MRLLYLLLLFLPVSITAQTAYDRSPVYAEAGLGLLPLSAFGVELSAAVGYRVNPRNGIGVGYHFFVVAQRDGEQMEAHGPVVQWNRQLLKNWCLTLGTGPVVGAVYDTGEFTEFRNPVFTGTTGGLTSFPVRLRSFRQRGGWLGVVQGGYHFRSGFLLGGYLNVVTPVTLTQGFFIANGAEPVTNRKGAVGGGVRFAYHFPRSLYR